MFGTGYSTRGKHYITINDKMIAQAISQTIINPIIKTKGKITLHPLSISVIAIKTPILHNTNNLYELNFDTFELPGSVVPLDVVHRVDHNIPQILNIPILNVNNSSCSISKGSPIATLTPVGKCKEVQEIIWSRLQCDTKKLLPMIPQSTSLQLEPDTMSSLKSILDADIPHEARVKLQDLLDRKYMHIMSQNVTDIGRTNLVELDILTEGPPIALKPYTILKYCEFEDHEIKQLEEAGIISQSMTVLSWWCPRKKNVWMQVTMQVALRMVNLICSHVLSTGS